MTIGSTGNVSGATLLIGCTVTRNGDNTFAINFGVLIPSPNPTPLSPTDGDRESTNATLYTVPGGYSTSLPAFSSVITNATNASPIVITTATPVLSTTIPVGCFVSVGNVAGNTAAIGSWPVQATTSNTITLMGSAGNNPFINDGLGVVSGPWDQNGKAFVKRLSTTMSLPTAFITARDQAIQSNAPSPALAAQYVYSTHIAWLDYVRQGGT